MLKQGELFIACTIAELEKCPRHGGMGHFGIEKLCRNMIKNSICKWCCTKEKGHCGPHEALYVNEHNEVIIVARWDKQFKVLCAL